MVLRQCRTSMAMAGLCSTRAGSMAGSMLQRCSVCSPSWIAWMICTVCGNSVTANGWTAIGVPTQLQFCDALYSFCQPSRLMRYTTGVTMISNMQHCTEFHLGTAMCPIESSKQGRSHTFCWSAGSRGPSRAGARMAGPVLLCSGACSGSSSGMDGSGAHHRVRPADAQIHNLADPIEGQGRHAEPMLTAEQHVQS